MVEESILDLQGIPCPINYVKTKIKLDSLSSGDVLTVLLDDGEPIESVSTSVVEDGHKILAKKTLDADPNSWELKVQRV